jgi:hypothetical protein
MENGPESGSLSGASSRGSILWQSFSVIAEVPSHLKKINGSKEVCTKWVGPNSSA